MQRVRYPRGCGSSTADLMFDPTTDPEAPARARTSSYSRVARGRYVLDGSSIISVSGSIGDSMKP
jgi:hypothetical protein